MTQGTARHFMPVPPHVVRATRQATNPPKIRHTTSATATHRANHMAPFVADLPPSAEPEPRATWPPSSPGPDTRPRHVPRAEAADKVGSRARYIGGGRRFTAPDRNICGRTCGTRPAPTNETNKPTRPQHTHTHRANRTARERKASGFLIRFFASRKTGTGGSVVHLF
jgi:hypothetical protein